MKSDIVSSRARCHTLGAVKDLEVRCEQIETNAIIRAKGSIPTDGPIPVASLLVLSGKLNGISARVLKDDGCNTNVISRRFFGLHRQRFHARKADVVVNHSREGWSEKASHVVYEGTLRIGSHTYTSNWLVADCRYDVLLGTPWHVANNPQIDYKKRIVTVNDKAIHFGKSTLTKVHFVKPEVTVTNLTVRKFRQMLKKKSPRNFEVFHVMVKDSSCELENVTTLHGSF